MISGQDSVLIRQLTAEIKELNSNITELLNRGFRKEDRYLTVPEVAKMLGTSEDFVYKLSHLKILPVHKPNGKRIYFLESDVLKYIGRRRRKSQEELENEVN
jgi:excisionase family DNA binding protein